MRPCSMKPLLAAALVLAAALPAAAQTSAPPNTGDPFKDTSMLKPPAGAKVAIIEFEDLECPSCAHAYPTVHAAIEHYKIPLVRYDFIISYHIWSREAAITARYLLEKGSPELSEQYRHDVFATQATIASREDLQNYTRKWFAAHGQKMPFVIDPSGVCAKEVQVDCDLGKRLGLLHTPTIIVVTAYRWVHVTDPT